MSKIVLLAHGSPDPRSGKAMRNFTNNIQSTIHLPTALAFLDHEGPNLVEVTEGKNPNNILVVPMLLSNAFHARFDVPKAMQEADLSHALPPIGNPVNILSELIRNAQSNVMVVSAGSSNNKAREDFREAVKIASKGQEPEVRTAFVTGPESSIGSVLDEIQNPIGITVVPWLLAEGRLLDVVLTSAMQHGATVMGNGLVEEASFLEYVGATIRLFLQSANCPVSEVAR